MFTGDNSDAHKGATQGVMEAAVHFRRAADSLMAAQALVSDPAYKEKLRLMRVRADSDSIFLDAMFQEAAQRYFT